MNQHCIARFQLAVVLVSCNFKVSFQAVQQFKTGMDVQMSCAAHTVAFLHKAFAQAAQILAWIMLFQICVHQVLRQKFDIFIRFYYIILHTDMLY